MESDSISHFSYFVDLFWPFFLGVLALRVVCGYVGDLVYWISRALSGQ